VVDVDGSFIGVMPTTEAIALTRTKSTKPNKLELTLVSTKPPVCRIQHEKDFIQGEIMKDGFREKIKEHRISEGILERDLQLKVRVVRHHLIDRYRVKMFVTFKDAKHPNRELAELILRNVQRRIEDLIRKEKAVISEERKEFFMLFVPNVKALEKRKALGIVEPTEGELQLEAQAKKIVGTRGDSETETQGEEAGESCFCGRTRRR